MADNENPDAGTSEEQVSTQLNDLIEGLDGVPQEDEKDGTPKAEEQADEGPEAPSTDEPESEKADESPDDKSEDDADEDDDDELGDIVESVEESDLYEDEEPAGLSYGDVSSIIRLIGKLHRADEATVKAVGVAMLGGESGRGTDEKAPSYLRIAELLTTSTAYTETVSDIADIYVSHNGGKETRADLFEQFQWANDLDEYARRSVAYAVDALAAAFPSDPKKPYRSKRTTKNTSGTEVSTIIEDSYSALDQEAFQKFHDFYTKEILPTWPSL